MTTKTSTTAPVAALSTEDQALADKMKARAEAKKERKLVFPPLMACL